MAHFRAQFTMGGWRRYTSQFDDSNGSYHNLFRLSLNGTTMFSVDVVSTGGSTVGGVINSFWNLRVQYNNGSGLVTAGSEVSDPFSDPLNGVFVSFPPNPSRLDIPELANGTHTWMVNCKGSTRDTDASSYAADGEISVWIDVTRVFYATGLTIGPRPDTATSLTAKHAITGDLDRVWLTRGSVPEMNWTTGAFLHGLPADLIYFDDFNAGDRSNWSDAGAGGGGAVAPTPQATFGAEGGYGMSTYSTTPFSALTRTIAYTAPSDTRVPIPVKPTAAPRTPCEPQSEVSNGGKGKAGCNTGGRGWVSIYDGDPGDVPQHDDPVDGETLTGKDLTSLLVWIEVHHVDYPSEAVTIYRRALGSEIADLDSYEGGRKPEGVLSVGDIEHAIGNEQGGDEATTISVEYSDIVDRLMRTLLDDQELEGDELYIKGSTPLARIGSPTTGPRVFARAIIQQAALG